jgi:hypothetical protein
LWLGVSLQGKTRQGKTSSERQLIRPQTQLHVLCAVFMAGCAPHVLVTFGERTQRASTACSLLQPSIETAPIEADKVTSSPLK